MISINFLLFKVSVYEFLFIASFSILICEVIIFPIFLSPSNLISFIKKLLSFFFDKWIGNYSCLQI